MNERLHFPNGEESAGLVSCETAGHCDEKRFIEIMVDCIMDALGVGWKDRRIVGALLCSFLKKELTDGRDGLLEQYLHTQLDIIAGSMRREFDVDDTVQVNYQHATHAKFSDLLNAIKERDK